MLSFIFSNLTRKSESLSFPVDPFPFGSGNLASTLPQTKTKLDDSGIWACEPLGGL